LSLALFNENGERIELRSESGPDGASEAECARGLIELTTPQREIVFTDVATRPVLSLLREFSAPVCIEPESAPEDLERQLAFDDDPFNRWQAAQSLGLRSILERIEAARDGRPAPDERAYIGALRRLIDAGESDPAFAALALTPPSEIDVAREIGNNVDPDAIFAARTGLRRAIGSGLSDALHDIYARLADARPYSPDAAAAGRRSLRNAALDLLAAGDPAAGVALGSRQFEDATNMTDRLAALSTLSNIRGDAREEAFAKFYARYSDDALVLDKWFMLQSVIPEPETTARVVELMRHKDFSYGNPNRVRAVVAAFANGNPTRFHALDGSGYDLLANTVLEIDSKNSQLAARLLSALRSWRSMEARRRAIAEKTLRRILEKPDLSRDVADIATRAVA
jgi:aminopeptidase N